MYYEIYQDAKKEWRWRLKSANHQIVATGGEGYTSKQGAEHGISLVKSSSNAPVREV